MHLARPLQASLASAATFAVGASLPMLLILLSPERLIFPFVAGGSLLSLALLGGLSAYVGGAKVFVGIVRVTILGALAMLVTVAIGALFGTIV
jgi:VIT1/CCC1 family predicted Fe2+/Mn2+ transporter